MNIRIRSSSLDTYPLCQRKFAADWLLTADPDLAQRYGLARRRPHIGAVVGSTVHEGVAFLMKELKSTGSHGGMGRLDKAHQASEGKFKGLMTDGPIVCDSTTRIPYDGLPTSFKILDRYYDDVRPKSEPTIIEEGLKMIVTSEDKDVEVTGTLDRYHIVDGYLRDCKTGRNRPSAAAQQGCYSLLLRSNGFDVESLAMEYGKRVAKNDKQPPIEVIELDRYACEMHANQIIRQCSGGLERMMKTGDPETMIANPKNMLCSSRHCSAYGTEFCAIGAMVNG